MSAGLEEDISQKLAEFRKVMDAFDIGAPGVDRGQLRARELALIISRSMELFYPLTERQYGITQSLEQSSKRLEGLAKKLNWLTLVLIIASGLTFLTAFADLLLRLGII